MNDKLEENENSVVSEIEPESPVTGLAPHARWLRVGLGLVAVIVILALAWPDLRNKVLMRSGVADASLAELQQAAETDPGNDALQYELAGAYYRARRFEDAWTQFRAVEAYRLAADAAPEISRAEQMVQADPASKETHFELGTALARAQLLVPAEIAYKQAIDLGGQYVDAHTNLGVVYYQMGRLSDAVAEYDAALAVDANDADVHHNKGAAYVQQAFQVSPPDETLLNQGVAEFQRALDIDPDLPQAHFSLGVVYVMRGQNQEAIAAFQRFLDLDDGTDPEATSAAHNYLNRLEQ
jgi:tetratricopeptide (TPR) repeat protein